ncbi:DNA topoisomerase [Dyadobacter frigoris]|uniref:type IA DNA topoisomerase n=1 Tax=Dyadobacter frigoris TaxID=2576211 RepID=UPI0024A03E69|nr:type IA DNA topoisomerase [Dyadobacter frigoris]GLU56483.1 DNA topoisomerase [Dyadobacter frigoris]
MKTVIAEKPSVARSIAEFLGATTKMDGYFEGNGYRVTWAIGHLVKLAELDSYPGFGEKNWALSIQSLPFVPKQFKLSVTDKDGIKQQYFKIKALFEQASEIIVATDAGQEGELIFRYIYLLTGSKKPFKRLWVSSLTNEAFQKGFNNLKPGSDYDNLYYAAKARSESDWILGINLTRVYTVKYANNDIRVVSIGRVQTPTLNLICQRYLDNQNFRKTAYYIPTLFLKHEKGSFPVKYYQQFGSNEEAENVLSRVGNSIICSSVEKSVVKTSPPKLFSLTHLQQHANKKFGLSAQSTLDTLQTLYEAKYVTYPRTDSNYLSDDMKGDVIKSLQFLKSFGSLAGQVTSILSKELNKSPFNNEKVTDHHAIIPTGEKPDLSKLTKEQQVVFLSVVERFIQTFSDDCIENKTILSFKIGSDGLFRVGGKVVIQSGWKAVNIFKTEETEESDDEENVLLPDVKEGDSCLVEKKKVHQGFTTAPQLFTEATLLKQMENASDTLEDTEAKFGIGTPATRANIIETLIGRSFIKRETKKLVPTQAGLSVYKLTHNELVGKIQLTAEFEEKLKLISAGQYSYSNFLTEIGSLAATSVMSVYTNEIEASSISMTSQTDKEKIMCPECKKGSLKENDKAFGCSEYKNSGCKFTIWKSFMGRTLTYSNIKDLVLKGKTKKLSFKSKAGKEYEALIIMKEGKPTLEFEQNKPAKA